MKTICTTRIFNIGLVFVVLLMSSGFIRPVSAGENISIFPYYKSLTAEETDTKPIGSFVLDDEIFAATGTNYNNMRIFDEAGVETQFLIRPRIKGKYVVREYNVPMEQVSFNLSQDNMIEIVLRNKQANVVPAVIEFITQQRDFEKQVTVFGSNDRKDWEVLVEKQPIFDYSRYIDLKNSRVEIPARQFAFYKIKLWNITETQQSPFIQICRETKGEAPLREMEGVSFLRKDFRIEQIKFIEKRNTFAESEKIIQVYNTKNFSIVSKNKETIVTFNTARQPLTLLKIDTDDSNFSRAVIVEGTNNINEQTEWSFITSGHISRINAGTFRQEQTTINFSGPVRFLFYRIKTDNLDSPVLNISGVKAEGQAHEALFFSKGSKCYRVFYGGEEITCPRYDINEVLKNVSNVTAGIFTAGPQEQNQDFVKSKKKPFFDGRKFFVIALVLMVAVLSWMIATVSKKVEQSSSGGSE